MVYLGLARRLGLVGGHGLVKTSWSCQMYHDVLGTWDIRYLKDTFKFVGYSRVPCEHICGKNP